MMKKIKVWIAPVLAAIALGVISCTQPNQAAHSAGAQYTGYITPNRSNSNVPVYPEFAKTDNGTYVYRIIDCQARSIVYTSTGGGITSIIMDNPRIYRELCGE
ncbi:hypothetical protein [Acinetobacter baumannii]|uniref:hypothetical protein n=1 Tax=Acinetobacter baumannii TaxID=470 RepID=UPI00366ADC60